MTERDYRAFHKEFDAMIKKYDVSAYALVMFIDAEKEEEESHTVVLSRVTPEEEVWVFMEKTRQVLFGLARTMLEIANPFYGLGPEATLGMLHGMITDISDECTAEELQDLAREADNIEELPELPARPKKAKPEWH
jgi:hypothetical protein